MRLRMLLGLLLALTVGCVLAEGVEDAGNLISDFAHSALRTVAFYNLFIGTSTKMIVNEQIDAMKSSGLLDVLDAVFYLPVAGKGKEAFTISTAKFRKLRVKAPTGWEEDTLGALYDFCHSHPAANVLYFHDKGSFHDDAKNSLFRRALNCFVLNPNCLEALKTHDTCGMRASPLPFIHYSGNFWWATCRHVRRLLPPTAPRVNATLIEVSKPLLPCSEHDQRYFAEQWIGSYPVFVPADCLDSTVDTSYLFGYNMPRASLTMCPNARTNRTGSQCGPAAAQVNASQFHGAFINIYTQLVSCADRRALLTERSLLWYGQRPETFLQWMKAIWPPRREFRNGEALRPWNSRTVYVYEDGKLRAIPNADTFFSMGLSFDHVTVLFAHELALYPIGKEIPACVSC